MTLWTGTPTQDYDVYTIVYLLKDALQSALNDAWFFERTSLPRTDIKGANHAEIAAKLGRFRDTCKTFQEREALMVTKLMRARIWAAELKKLSTEMEQDANQFLEATEPCEEMQAEFLKDAQRMFNGGNSLTRFLSQRKPGADAGAPAGFESTASPYLVGGRTALYELRVACEVFLGQIDEVFFSSAPESEVPAPVTAYLQAEEEPILPLSLSEEVGGIGPEMPKAFS
ncbi:MAG: hypothetical protein WBX25_24650 [Rhodomicrobium sp.]